MTFPPVVSTQAMIGLSFNGVLGIVMILKVVQGEPVEVVLVRRDQEVNHELDVMKMEKLLHETSTPNADNLFNGNTQI